MRWPGPPPPCPDRAAPPPSASARPCAASSADTSFRLNRPSLARQGASPRLLAKLAESPYRYFRALGPQFAAKTCAAFPDVKPRLATAAVHGDAHLEQFVVTGHTYGVEDFDQSGYGSAVVDLVRYAASIHVACREVSFACDAERAAAAYFGAYRDAIDRRPIGRNRPPSSTASAARPRKSPRRGSAGPTRS